MSRQDNAQIIAEAGHAYDKLLDAGKLGEALPLIRQAAYWGDERSQNLARRIYLHGEYGHVYAPQAGYDFALMSAMNGSAEAMNDMADLCLELKHGKEAEEGAFYWRAKAADAGFAPAYDPLGMMYLQAKGTARNLDKAQELFAKALQADPNGKAADHLVLCEKMKARQADKDWK